MILLLLMWKHSKIVLSLCVKKYKILRDFWTSLTIYVTSVRSMHWCGRKSFPAIFVKSIKNVYNLGSISGPMCIWLFSFLQVEHALKVWPPISETPWINRETGHILLKHMSEQWSICPISNFNLLVPTHTRFLFRNASPPAKYINSWKSFSTTTNLKLNTNLASNLESCWKRVFHNPPHCLFQSSNSPFFLSTSPHKAPANINFSSIVQLMKAFCWLEILLTFLYKHSFLRYLLHLSSLIYLPNSTKISWIIKKMLDWPTKSLLRLQKKRFFETKPTTLINMIYNSIFCTF